MMKTTGLTTSAEKFKRMNYARNNVPQHIISDVKIYISIDGNQKIYQEWLSESFMIHCKNNTNNTNSTVYKSHTTSVVTDASLIACFGSLL